MQFSKRTPDTSPFELVLLVPDVVGLVVGEKLGDARGQVAVDAVHVAGRGHDGADVLVAVLDALVHLRPGTGQTPGQAPPRLQRFMLTPLYVTHATEAQRRSFRCISLSLPPAGRCIDFSVFIEAKTSRQDRGTPLS